MVNLRRKRPVSSDSQTRDQDQENDRSRSLCPRRTHSPPQSPILPPPDEGPDPIPLVIRATNHLTQVDPDLRPLIDKYPCDLFSPPELARHVDAFEFLAVAIIGQQISGAAARAVKSRVIAAFPPLSVPDGSHFPSSAQIAAADPTTLRAAGLSTRKVEYIQDLASRFQTGQLDGLALACAPLDEVVAKITAVRGLGVWSAQMFAVFALKRPDVISPEDLAFQRGVACYLGKDVRKLKKGKGKWKYCSQQEILDTAAKFAPFR